MTILLYLKFPSFWFKWTWWKCLTIFSFQTLGFWDFRNEVELTLIVFVLKIGVLSTDELRLVFYLCMFPYLCFFFKKTSLGIDWTVSQIRVQAINCPNGWVKALLSFYLCKYSVSSYQVWNSSQKFAGVPSEQGRISWL